MPVYDCNALVELLVSAPTLLGALCELFVTTLVLVIASPLLDALVEVLAYANAYCASCFLVPS